MKNKTFTIQEIWDASKSRIFKSKKEYNRKPKHKNKKDGGFNT